MPTHEPSPVPVRFNAFIGGFMGESYCVELKQGELIYTSCDTGYSNPTSTIITPTAEQWRKFRQVLNDIQLWEWLAEYRCQDVMDGTHWSLEITYADRALETNGSNCYPDSSGDPNGSPEPTKAFHRFLAAITKLTGGKTFQ